LGRRRHAIIGSAAALFPALRRHNEGLALANVGLRTLESGLIMVGVVSLLAVVTLRQDQTDAAGAQAAGVGAALVAVHGWTFLLGPSFVLGTSTTLLAYALYASRLVPRVIAILGLVGGPLVLASATATLFGVYDQVSAYGAAAALPVFAWEISLAVRLVVRGFRPATARSG
jgi:hypothetical protein